MLLIQTVLTQLILTTSQVLRNTAVLAVVFTLLATVVSACNKTPPWWRKPDLRTDICWVLVPQLFYKFASTLMLVVGIAACYGITDPDGIKRFFTEGLGPLAHLGFWPQVALYLVGNDLVMYSTHRLLHSARMWRFHAVHHSSEQLEWISGARAHPIDQMLHSIMADVVMVLLGIPPEILVWLAPFTIGSSALVHANLDWDFGVFRYVLASPVFHRWHHTSAERGGSSNFAGTFPLFDLIFGTFYMPANQRPDAYGVDDPHFPQSFIGQIRHPFARRHRATTGSSDGRELPSTFAPVQTVTAGDGV